MTSITDPLGRNDTCTWVEDSEGTWESECGSAYGFFEGGPKENHVRFCHQCGGKVQVKPYQNPFDEDDQ